MYLAMHARRISSKVSIRVKPFHARQCKPSTHTIIVTCGWRSYGA